MTTQQKNKIILLESSDSISSQSLNKYKEAYIFSGTLINAKNIPCDLMVGADKNDSYYRAGKLIDSLYQQYIVSREQEILNSIMKDNRAYLIIKKTIMLALGKLIYSFILAEKFIKEYSIDEVIDFIPEPFSYSLYQFMVEQKGYLPSQVVIPPWYLKKMKYREFLKNSLLRLKLIFYPAYLALRMRGRFFKKTSRKAYQYGIHLWDTWVSAASPPYRMTFLEDRGYINRNNSLYIIDGVISKINIQKVKSYGFEVCIFKEMVRKHSLFRYMKDMYPLAQKISYKLFKMSSSKILVTESYLRSLQGYLTWEIFFLNYDVKLFLAFQEPGTIQKSICQKMHNAKSIFILWSAICDRLSRKDMNAHVDSYYGFMVYDVLISSQIGNNYCKKNNNFIGEYKNCGICGADTVYNLKNNSDLKAKLKQELGIPADKKIIGFWDTSFGHKAAFTIAEGVGIIDDVYRLLESNSNYYLVYKSREYHRLQRISELKVRLDKLLNHERVCHLDRLNSHYGAYELMGVCDLSIGIFSSTALLESVAGGIPTICYIPSDRYNKEELLFNTFPYFCVTDYEQLEKCSDYWLSNPEDIFKEFQDTYIKKYVDSYCDGRAAERLRSIICQ